MRRLYNIARQQPGFVMESPRGMILRALTEIVLKRMGNRRENFMTVVFFYLSKFLGVELINTMNRGGYKYNSLSLQKSAGL